MKKTIIGLLSAGFFVIAGCENTEPVAGIYPSKGIASWYTARQTSSGEEFNGNALTCALRRADYGKSYQVCNDANGKCVVVRHNNFGPAKRLYSQGRVIDLTRAAFSKISDLETGVIRVTIKEVSDPS